MSTHELARLLLAQEDSTLEVSVDISGDDESTFHDRCFGTVIDYQTVDNRTTLICEEK